MHAYRGESGKALEYASRVREIDPAFRFSVTHLRNEDVRAGRIDDALERYRTLFPEFLDDLVRFVSKQRFATRDQVLDIRE